jgi:hypothetical protein
LGKDIENFPAIESKVETNGLANKEIIRIEDSFVTLRDTEELFWPRLHPDSLVLLEYFGNKNIIFLLSNTFFNGCRRFLGFAC